MILRIRYEFETAIPRFIELIWLFRASRNHAETRIEDKSQQTIIIYDPWDVIRMKKPYNMLKGFMHQVFGSAFLETEA